MSNFTKTLSKKQIIFFTSFIKHKYNFNIPVTGFNKINNNNCSTFINLDKIHFKNLKQIYNKKDISIFESKINYPQNIIWILQTIYIIANISLGILIIINFILIIILSNL